MCWFPEQVTVHRLQSQLEGGDRFKITGSEFFFEITTDPATTEASEYLAADGGDVSADAGDAHDDSAGQDVVDVVDWLSAGDAPKQRKPRISRIGEDGSGGAQPRRPAPMPPDNSLDEYDIFFQNLEQQVGRCSVDVPSSDDEGGSSDDADSTQVVDPAGIDVNTLSADDEIRRNCLTLMRDVSLKDDICRALGFTLDTSWVLRRNSDGGQAGHLTFFFDGPLFVKCMLAQARQKGAASCFLVKAAWGSPREC